MGSGLLLLTYPTLGSVAQLIHLGVGLWFTEAVLFLGLPFVMIRYSGRDPVRFVGLRYPGIRSCLIGLAAGILNYFAAVVPLQYLSTSILPDKMLRAFDQSRIFAQPSPADLLIILLGVLIAAPLGEEFFFRGLLQRGLLRKPEGFADRGLSPFQAVLAVSFVFSAFHFDPVGFLARWELGILFGYLALRSGSIWPGMFAHAANNGISSVLFFLTQGSQQTEETPALLPILTIASLGLLGMAALFAFTKRHPKFIQSPYPAEDVTLPPSKPLSRLFLPWVGGGLLAMGLVFALDPRGVRLNLIDQQIPVDEPPKDPSADSENQRMAHGVLMAIRAKARRGELPLAFYEEKRRALMSQPKSGKRNGPHQEPGDFVPGEQAVEVHLARPTRPKDAGAVDDNAQLDSLEKKIADAVATSKTGTLDAKETSPKQRVLFLYGPNAQELVDTVRATLKGAPIPDHSYLRIRSGGQTAPFHEEPLNN